MKSRISVDFDFSSAHALPLYDGICKRMHGHNYKLRVVLTGELDRKSGMVRDFEEIKKKVWAAALETCDHHCLNDFLPNPTAELVSLWIWDQLQPVIQGLEEIHLWERPDYCVSVSR